MATSSNLTIATKALQRLIKEEASYHSELALQEERIKALESQGTKGDNKEKGVVEDEDAAGDNFEFLMGQEVGFCFCFSPFLSLSLLSLSIVLSGLVLLIIFLVFWQRFFAAGLWARKGMGFVLLFGLLSTAFIVPGDD